MTEERLARRIGLFDATMVVMGGIIGSGIFVTPATVASFSGTRAGMLAAWIAGGVRVAATGELTVRYSAEALDRSEEAAPGVLPRSAILGAWREVW